MTNKRIVWLALFFILCLVGGGLYYALSSEPYPCEIKCQGDLFTKLRFFVDQKYIVSKLLQYAKEKGEDTTKWDRVEINYFGGRWLCSVYQQDEKDWADLWLEINANGVVKQLGVSLRALRAAQKEWKARDAELKMLQDRLRLDMEQIAKWQKEYEDEHGIVDFLIQPLIW